MGGLAVQTVVFGHDLLQSLRQLRDGRRNGRLQGGPEPFSRHLLGGVPGLRREQPAPAAFGQHDRPPDAPPNRNARKAGEGHAACNVKTQDGMPDRNPAFLQQISIGRTTHILLT
jgi:hypothetical protein